MEETNKLLETLANKLNTTVEYLWDVLIKQAPINATTNLIFVIFTFICMYVFYRVHVSLMKKDMYTDDRGFENLITVIPMVLIGIFLLIMFIVSLCMIGNIINGFFNPEYWALQHILKG